MKLKTLKVQNFVGIPKAEVSFDKPVTLFVGKNNQGKSTVRDAILFALTGRCRAMKFNKDVANIMYSSDGMLTELDYVDDGGTDNTITRSKSTISINADDRESLHYCLNPSEFIALTAKERSNILAEVLGGGMDEVIEDAIAEHIGNIYETILSELKGSGVKILDVDAFRKQIVEIRRSYKRLIADLPDQALLLGDYKLEEGYDVTADQEVVKTLAERIAKGGQLLADARAMLKTRAEILELEKAIKQIDAEHKDVPSLPCGVSEEKLNITPVYMAILETMLGSTGPKVTCSCPVCKTYVSHKIAQTRLYDLSSWFKKYQPVMDERAAAIVRNEALDYEHDIKSKLLEEALKNVITVEIPKGGEDLLEQLTAERDQAQQRISEFRRYEIDKSTFEKAGTKREALNVLIDECDRIDAALKNGGPVKAAIAVGGRTLPINDVLLRMWNMESLSWSDNGEIKLGDLPIEYASASEKYRAGCVLGIAIAEVSGIGVAALDGFEVLDADNANALFEVIDRCKLNNVLVLASSNRDYRQWPESPDYLSIYEVDQGKVNRIR